ncbi:MAG: helix-turn-helix domain-containing protein, partial [Candidatus Dojkabacteria bacterium]|nr:helix-turn-helix domain-containing protein [Candidatus Dojkabacteria bacterium]
MITAGEVLKAKREKLRKSLSIISEETKIQKRYLQYIENNDFSKFDSEVFLVGFIKIYAKYLDLDSVKVLALYRRSNPTKRVNTVKKEENNIFKKPKITITPRILITISIILFVLGIFTYIGIQIYKFQSPPKLAITEPSNDSTVTEEMINIRGTISQEATLEINGELVNQDNGKFEHTIQLNEGVNIINIKARKNNNNILETSEIIKVTYTKEIENHQEEERPQENKLILEIVNSSAWIKLDIDDENKV